MSATFDPSQGWSNTPIRQYAKLTSLLFLAVAFICSSAISLPAQVTSDDAVINNSDGFQMNAVVSGTINNFMVPPGSNKLLLVSISLVADGGVTVNTVQYGAQNLIAAPGNPFNHTLFGPSTMYFYYLPLGEVNVTLNQNVVVNLSAIIALGQLNFFATSYAGVVQNNPLDGQMGNDIPTNATTSSVNIASANEDMVVDFIVASPNTTFTVGPDQMDAHTINPAVGNTIDLHLSEESSISATTTMSWTLASAGSGGGHYAINLNSAPALAPPAPGNVPTLSQWGVIVLALFLAIMGTIAIKVRKKRGASWKTVSSGVVGFGSFIRNSLLLIPLTNLPAEVFSKCRERSGDLRVEGVKISSVQAKGLLTFLPEATK